jgi:nodulation protein E
MRRVAITGMGAINALGHDAAATWSAMREGRPAIGPIANIATDLLLVKIAAEVRDYDPLKHFDSKRLILLDRVSQFALIAAREAIAQAGLEFRASGLGERTACIIGTGIGGENSHNEQSSRFYGDKNPRVHPLAIVRVMANAPACHVGMDFGLTGPSFAVVSACASANHAMGQAFEMVRSGKVDFAVTGGSEACVTVPTIKAWEAMRVTADDTCRPFCKQRRGMVLGEGAGIFVLEEYEHARRRGATILAEFAGAGMSADAGDIVLPSETGAAKALAAALADARLVADDVDYINAHGTGTEAGDIAESHATMKVLGPDVPISSTKGHTGHTLGACGALESAFCLSMMHEKFVPPTRNLEAVDPRCAPLNFVRGQAQDKAKMDIVMNNNFAFGGINTSLLFRRVS